MISPTFISVPHVFCCVNFLLKMFIVKKLKIKEIKQIIIHKTGKKVNVADPKCSSDTTLKCNFDLIKYS